MAASQRTPSAEGAVTIVVRLPDEQVERIAERVLERMRPARALLTRSELADVTGYSLSTVAKWLNEGVPVIRYGDAPRFELDRVLEWLREQSAKAGA